MPRVRAPCLLLTYVPSGIAPPFNTTPHPALSRLLLPPSSPGTGPSAVPLSLSQAQPSAVAGEPYLLGIVYHSLSLNHVILQLPPVQQQLPRADCLAPWLGSILHAPAGLGIDGESHWHPSPSSRRRPRRGTVGALSAARGSKANGYVTQGIAAVLTTLLYFKQKYVLLLHSPSVKVAEANRLLRLI